MNLKYQKLQVAAIFVAAIFATAVVFKRRVGVGSVPTAPPTYFDIYQDVYS
jgi:hypothetical protein